MKRVPWLSHYAIGKDLYYVDYHLARLKVTTGTKPQILIVYYASIEHACAGRQSEMKPTRYLTKFYPNADKEDIKHWLDTLRAMLPLEILFATTAASIERVYMDGPNSCMSHPFPSFHFSSTMHPVRAYGKGDLSVAYTKRNGRIVARCVVWARRKIYGRIYGDAAVMANSFNIIGYESGECFDGAKIDHIVQNGSRGQVGALCPYIDLPGCEYARVSLDRKYLILTEYADNEAWEASTQVGIVPEDIVDQFYCEYADHYVDENGSGFADNMSVCTSCLEQNFTCCCDCDEMIHDKCTVEDHKGHSVCEECFDCSSYNCVNCDNVISQDDIKDGWCRACVKDEEN